MNPHPSSTGPWSCLLQDVKRYGGWAAFFKEQSLWAVAWYRLGTAILALPNWVWPLRRVLMALWWFIFRFIEMFTGVSLPATAKIGPGLRIWHFGNIFVNGGAVIGANCTLRQGVTIGNRHEGGGAPTIADNVEIGASAMIIGAITVGDNARVGAMSLVLSNVEPSATVVGIPARVVERCK